MPAQHWVRDMKEREFFSGEDVYVSLTRFVVLGQTYAMSGVTSVKAHTIKPSRFWPVVAVVLAVLCVFAGGKALIFGALLLVLSIMLWFTQRAEYIILLSTSSGEVQALKSQDREYISAVVQALNDCIVARG
jgi:hypothetical protein